MEQLKEFVSNLNGWSMMLVCVAAVLLVVGLFKKTLWMCIVAVILSIILGFSHPTQLEQAKDAVFEFFNGGIEPLKDEDYENLIGEENLTTPNKSFKDIGKDLE